MIYTLTVNPALDYEMLLPHFALGAVNRAQGEALRPGGKGINVSIMLGRLGMASTVLGFRAGQTGQMLSDMLEQQGCIARMVELERGETRINVKLRMAAEPTQINADGPPITAQAVAALREPLRHLVDGDVLVLAGNLPSSLPAQWYADILAQLPSGVLSVVDTSGEALPASLACRPFLVKPNVQELCELLGEAQVEAQALSRCARRVQEMGARNVLLSLGEGGALFLSEAGEEMRMEAPAGKLIGTVGAGDSMVAGFLCGYVRTGCWRRALELGVCAGSATAYAPWLGERAQVLALLPQDPTLYGFM